MIYDQTFLKLFLSFAELQSLFVNMWKAARDLPLPVQLLLTLPIGYGVYWVGKHVLLFMGYVMLMTFWAMMITERAQAQRN